MSDRRLVPLVITLALAAGAAPGLTASAAAQPVTAPVPQSQPTQSQSQPATVPVGPVLPPPGTPLTLADTVRHSLEKAPLIQLAVEQVNAERGNLRQARGAFDATVQIEPLFEHREDAIENTAFFNPERVKRGFANGLRDGFGAVAKSLGDQIALGRGDLPLCPPEGTFSTYYVTLPGSVFPVPLCRPASLSLAPPTVDDSEGFDNSFLFRQALPFDPLSNFALQTLLTTAFRAQVSTASLEARERGAELLLSLQKAARIVEVKAGLVAERLGVLPEFVFGDTTSIFASFNKPLRNGSIFGFELSFDGRATMFRDKPIDPTFGGTNNDNRFGNRIELLWAQPLKRGRGADTVRAAERAAQKNIEASQFSYQQTAADQALQTANAYFALMAARDALALNRESLTTQRRMLDNTIRLVGAGEVASADVARGRARTAEVEAAVESSRLDMVAAQGQLADAMGLPGDALVNLVVADTFPVAPTELDIEALSRDAVTRRSDLRSFTAFQETSRILLAAAKADTRYRFDVQFKAGVAQAYFGPTFHSLGDENGVHLTNDDYLKYFNPIGIGRAFKERWEPVGSVIWNVELPFGNNQRVGRFHQALASARESDVRVGDLRRTIENTVPKIADNLRQIKAEWLQRQDAVIQYESTWDAAQRLRAAGDLTLIDTLITEQQLTQARLQLVQSKRDYALAVARFRRETGTLVSFPEWSRAVPNLAGIVATP